MSRLVVFLVVCFSARERGCLLVKDNATVFESGPRTRTTLRLFSRFPAFSRQVWFRPGLGRVRVPTFPLFPLFPGRGSPEFTQSFPRGNFQWRRYTR